jgi:signal transduction histidine kinase
MGGLDHILDRIKEKKSDFGVYSFTPDEDLAIKTFYDLAQELDSLNDLYHLCVAIPKVFFDLNAHLYLVNPRDNKLMLVSSPDNEGEKREVPPVPEGDYAYTGRESLVVKVRGKKSFLDQLPFKSIDDAIGLMELEPARDLDTHLELFFIKYANRVGFNLHNRFIVEKNIEHLRFVRSLVADIEHNIISPNIVYKLYIKNLEAALKKSIKAEEALKPVIQSMAGEEKEAYVTALQELDDANMALMREVGEISRHHKNASMFLESLLRRSHFDQGRLTLRKKRCGMLREVVLPQLERYYERLASLGISVDHQASGIPEEDIVSVVDIGLMSQVYANFFSNALKYTSEVETPYGKKKYLTYGHQEIREHFGPESDGIKYNVFTTGPHIPEEEQSHIYEDQYRGSNVKGRPGSGHGLHFIKNIVEIHGGVVGYEPTEFGNNFYFVLPKERLD